MNLSTYSINLSFPTLVKLAGSENASLRVSWLREVRDRRKLHEELQKLRGNVRVYCRIRPTNEDTAARVLDVDRLSLNNREFKFDRVFGPNSKTHEVAKEISPLVVSALDGYPFCLFAFGQTGSGKTFSMEGGPGEKGVYSAVFSELFSRISQRAAEGWSYDHMAISVLEIYNDDIKDLLGNTDKLSLKQRVGGGFTVSGLSVLRVSCASEAYSWLSRGLASRAVGAHNLNERSSRSHLITQLQFDITSPGGTKLPAGIITLVDLAGSERLGKSGAERDAAREAIYINKSLSALGDVIHAKATKAPHVPYRNSLLTSLLQLTLQGDAKTIMLLQINPSNASVDESLVSLNFGLRVAKAETRKK